MRKISFLVLVGILAFPLESCSLMSTFAKKSVETVVEDEKKDVKQSNINPKLEKNEPKTSKAEAFQSTGREEHVAGLIPATKPDIRVRSSIRGRKDPFAVVAIQPQIEIKKDKKRVKSIPKPTISPSTTPGDFSSIPNLEEISVANLAENVVITGLVESSDRIELIVRAPEETSARYVEIGQYLSNGQVLVKRIEHSFPTPLVILEQNGVEVKKPVGEVNEYATLE